MKLALYIKCCAEDCQRLCAQDCTYKAHITILQLCWDTQGSNLRLENISQPTIEQMSGYMNDTCVFSVMCIAQQLYTKYTSCILNASDKVYASAIDICVR
jgi:hypothetical protein